MGRKTTYFKKHDLTIITRVKLNPICEESRHEWGGDLKVFPFYKCFKKLYVVKGNMVQIL